MNEETYVSMGAPNERGMSSSGGTLTIGNFICHPLVALVFRIEYRAVLPNGERNETVQFTLGWTAHLPNFN